MKKNALSFVLTLLLILSLAACGNSKEGNTALKDDSITLEDKTATEETTEEPVQTGGTEPASEMQQPNLKEQDTVEETSAAEETTAAFTLEEYVGMMQDAIADLSASLEDSGITVSIEARGSSLVYVYQYTIDVGDADAVKESLEDSMPSLEEMNTGLLADLRQVVPDAESLVYEYLDMDGNVITTIEYK